MGAPSLSGVSQAEHRRRGAHGGTPLQIRDYSMVSHSRVGSGGPGSVIGTGRSGSRTGAGGFGSESGGTGIGVGNGSSGFSGSYGAVGGGSGFSVSVVRLKFIVLVLSVG